MGTVIDRSFVETLRRNWASSSAPAELDRYAEGGTAVTENGETVPLRSHVNARYARFLFELVKLLEPERILEIGLGHGVSTAYIASAQQSYLRRADAHVVIDPFQTRDWGGAGLAALRRLGLDGNLRVVERLSIHALPELERAGERFDFAFIDGNHCLDFVLADVLLVDRVLRTDGLMALDDAHTYGVKHAIGYLDRHRPNLRRVVLDGAIGHWWREKVGKRRRIAVYRKVEEDRRPGAST